MLMGILNPPLTVACMLDKTTHSQIFNNNVIKKHEISNKSVKVVPRYWSQNNPPYKVDFLIQRENENDIFPVEVKSEANISSKSLKKFKELFPDKVKLRVRFSLDNLKLDDDVLNIPLFMADQTDRLIGLALEQKRKDV